VFLVGAMATVSMLFTHRNLAGLEVRVADADPVFAGDTARFPVRLHNPRPYSRQSLWVTAGGFRGNTEVAARASAELRIPAHAASRGYCHPPGFRLTSAFPFGLLYSWSTAIRPGDAKALVYPRARGDAPLPVSAPERSQVGIHHHEGDDFAGLREYQSGDSPRHVHWKASAASQSPITKQFGGGAGKRLWLDWALTSGDTETRLSQLTAWACQAEQQGLAYGLRLPGQEVAPDSGPRHRHQCLKALALWGSEASTVV